MTTVMKWFAGSLLALVLLCAVLALLGVAVAAPFGDEVIQINGEEVRIAQLHGGHWLGAMVGLLVAGVVVLFVVPVVVLVPLALVAVLLSALLALAAGVVAVVFSPLLVLAAVVWLIWRIARGKKPAADATIAG